MFNRIYMVGIFIHGWKKPSLLAKLVYRENDVVFLNFSEHRSSISQFSHVSSIGFVEQLKNNNNIGPII